MNVVEKIGFDVGRGKLESPPPSFFRVLSEAGKTEEYNIAVKKGKMVRTREELGPRVKLTPKQRRGGGGQK